LVAHLQFFQTHKAKQKTAKELPSQRTKKNKMDRILMTKTKHEPVTRGIFNCRDSRYLKACTSQTLV